METVILSPATSPVVRDRLIDVLAAAAFTYRKEGFESTWKLIRPPGKPEDGIPFDFMFDPPMQSPRTLSLTRPTPQVPPMNAPGSPHAHRLSSKPQDSDQGQHRDPQPRHKRALVYDAPTEEMRRLFEECDVARYNTHRLNEALLCATPESFRSNLVIRVRFL